MSDAEVLGTLAEAFERMSAGASPTGNYFFAVNAADAAASLKRIDGAASEIERLRGDLEVARLRLEAAHAEIDRLRSLTRFQDRVIRSGDTACLTKAERDAVEGAIIHMETRGMWAWPAELRGLLERLG